MIECYECGRRIRDGQRVVAIGVVTGNSSRGDFVSSVPDAWVHYYCIKG